MAQHVQDSVPEIDAADIVCRQIRDRADDFFPDISRYGGCGKASDVMLQHPQYAEIYFFCFFMFGAEAKLQQDPLFLVGAGVKRKIKHGIQKNEGCCIIQDAAFIEADDQLQIFSLFFLRYPAQHRVDDDLPGISDPPFVIFRYLVLREYDSVEIVVAKFQGGNLAADLIHSLRKFLSVFLIKVYHDDTHQFCRQPPDIPFPVHQQFIQIIHGHQLLPLGHISGVFIKNIDIRPNLFPLFF